MTSTRHRSTSTPSRARPTRSSATGGQRSPAASSVSPRSSRRSPCSRNGGDTRQPGASLRRRPADRDDRRPRPPALDYVLDGTWHQADGDVVQLPKTPSRTTPRSSGTTSWSRPTGTARSISIADVIDEDGTVVDTVRTTSPVVVNDAGTTIAWIDTDGSDVMTAGTATRCRLGTVDLRRARRDGRVVRRRRSPVGRLRRHDELDGCVVYLNSNLGEESRSLRLARHRRRRRARGDQGVRRHRRRHGQRDQRGHRRPRHLRRTPRPDRRHPSVDAPATTRSSRSRRTAATSPRRRASTTASARPALGARRTDRRGDRDATRPRAASSAPGPGPPTGSCSSTRTTAPTGTCSAWRPRRVDHRDRRARSRATSSQPVHADPALSPSSSHLHSEGPLS